MASLRARVRQDLGVAELCRMSRAALDRPLLHAAELLVAVPRDEGLVFGAHQRTSEVQDVAAKPPFHHRGSGGAEARAGTGTVWLQLALAQSGALVPCPPERLLNRYVRPLLRAITKLGVLAHYFERDWVSGAKRPVAAIAFAHDATTGRAFVEAIVAVSTPFAVRARASTMGKEPGTLGELGMRADAAALAEGVVAAYEDAYGVAEATEHEQEYEREQEQEQEYERDATWAAIREEAIGIVGAGRDRAGRFRVGGEIMVSRDALRRLEAGLAALPATTKEDAIGELVDATLGAPGVALFGVRSLRSIRDVIVEARARSAMAQDASKIGHILPFPSR
jgi:hypothetical protein